MSTGKRQTKYEILINLADVLNNAHKMDKEDYIYARFFNQFHVAITDFKKAKIEYHPIKEGMKVVVYSGEYVVKVDPKKGFHYPLA